MESLITTILWYESDTFSSDKEGMTEAEATQIAIALLAELVETVATGGTLVCDGDVLAQHLYTIRASDDEGYPGRR